MQKKLNNKTSPATTRFKPQFGKKKGQQSSSAHDLAGWKYSLTHQKVNKFASDENAATAHTNSVTELDDPQNNNCKVAASLEPEIEQVHKPSAEFITVISNSFCKSESHNLPQESTKAIEESSDKNNYISTFDDTIENTVYCKPGKKSLRENKKSTTEKKTKSGMKTSEKCKKSTVKKISEVEKTSEEKEQRNTVVIHFIEHQKQLASTRNLIRAKQQQKEMEHLLNESKKAGDEQQFTMETNVVDFTRKLESLDGEILLLKTLMTLVNCLTENQQDHEKCLPLFKIIRQTVTSPAILLTYPIVFPILESAQRYSGDERVKQAAESVFMLFNSMYAKQDNEDFVSAFNRNFQRRQWCLASLCKKTMKALSENGAVEHSVKFNVEKWISLMKQRKIVWEKFFQNYYNPANKSEALVVVSDDETEGSTAVFDRLKEQMPKNGCQKRCFNQKSENDSNASCKSLCNVQNKRLKTDEESDNKDDVKVKMNKTPDNKDNIKLELNTDSIFQAFHTKVKKEVEPKPDVKPKVEIKKEDFCVGEID